MPKRKTDLLHLPANPSPIELARDLEVLHERQLRQLELSAAKATRDAYALDMRQFEAWCAQRGAKSLPCTPAVLGLYLAHLERLGRKPSTIGRKLAGIVRHHTAQGMESPRSAIIAEQMKGIRRGEDGERRGAIKKAPPMTTEELLILVRTMNAAPATHAALVARDKAALLIGWACAMRRSEIAGLEVTDAEHTREGWKIWIRRSKTDQTGKGIALALAPAERQKEICPVAALEGWLELRGGPRDGALFWKSCEQEEHRTVTPRLLQGEPMPWQQLNRLVRRWCRQAKLTPSGAPFSPHSLRAGFITEAIATGKSIALTKERSRHVSMDVFFGYVRVAQTFENNAQKGLM
jgi:integrase